MSEVPFPHATRLSRRNDDGTIDIIIDYWWHRVLIDDGPNGEFHARHSSCMTMTEEEWMAKARELRETGRDEDGLANYIEEKVKEAA